MPGRWLPVCPEISLAALVCEGQGPDAMADRVSDHRPHPEEREPPPTRLTTLLPARFLAQVRWATDLWPWPAKTLSYIFIASILAAIAVPLLWIALTGEAAAVRAGALDLTVMYGGMFVYVLTLIGNPHEPRLWPYAVAFGLATAGSAGAFLFARSI